MESYIILRDKIMAKVATEIEINRITVETD
jgi:hypothetical protein